MLLLSISVSIFAMNMLAKEIAILVPMAVPCMLAKETAILVPLAVSCMLAKETERTVSRCMESNERNVSSTSFRRIHTVNG